MKEDFLQYIWGNTLFCNNEFITHSGTHIRVIDPGQYNRDAGPDFFNARLEVNGVVLAGNIEVHLLSSDWYRHEHHKDAAYENVILSVVGKDDMHIYTRGGRLVDCVVLHYAVHLYDEYRFMKASRRKPGCYRKLEYLDDAWFYLTLHSLAIERLERKVNDIRKIFRETGNDWEESFYRLLCKYWSGNVNSDAFYQLATVLPFRVLLRYSDRLQALEALLLGTSGLLEEAPEDGYVRRLKKEYAYFRVKHALQPMNPVQWKFMRIRPEAFPTLRLALLAVFLGRFGNMVSRILEADAPEDIFRFWQIQASPYWDTHYSFRRESPGQAKRMGHSLHKILFINAVIPFLFLFGKERGEEKYADKAVEWLEDTEAEKNYIVRDWEKCGFVFDSALQTQALIQLRKEYCDKHRCLHCRIGREVLKSIGKY